MNKLSTKTVLSILFCIGLWQYGQSQVEQCTNDEGIYIESDIQSSDLVLGEISKQTNEHTYNIVTHGKSGQLLINGSWLDAQEIAAFLQQRKGDANHINIYGCEFAKGETGREAVSYLQAALGVSISASDDITGVDGDWELEVGKRTTLELSNYQYNLQTCDGDVGGTDAGDDYDGDGYCNVDDLDDDNDGILDSEECNGTRTNSSMAITSDPADGSDEGTFTNANGGTSNWSIDHTTLGGSIDDAGVSPAGGIFYKYNMGTTGDLTATFTAPVIEYEQITLYGNIGNGDSFQSKFKDYTITWTGGGLATVYDPADQLLPAGSSDSFTISSGGLVEQRTTLANSSLEWYIVLPIGVQEFTLSAPDGTALEGFRFAISTLVCQDTDMDGIPNTLDLDSDGDGCSDAVEGGENFGPSDTSSSSSIPGGNSGTNYNGIVSYGITDNLTTTDVDANGVPNAVTDQATGQSVGLSTNVDAYDPNCECNDPEKLNSNCDFDGDGINNSEDLDDDNDGILDTDEQDCPSTNGFNSAGSGGASNPDNANGAPDGSYGVIAAGDIITVEINPVPEGATITAHVGSNNTNSKMAIETSTDGTNWVSVGNYDYNATDGLNIVAVDVTAPEKDTKFIRFRRTAGQGKVDAVVAEVPCNNLDTDGDGNPDHLDTDADGDGCPDAIEGSGSYDSDDLASNDSLCEGATCVDTDSTSPTYGVPIVSPATTAVTQDIGDSRDPDTRGPDCEDPTCEQAGTVAFANFVAANPTSAIALEDCDGDGVTNLKEVDPNGNGTPNEAGEGATDPSDPCDFVEADQTLTPTVDPVCIEAENDANQIPAGGTANGNLLTNDKDPGGTDIDITSMTGLDSSGSPIAISTDSTSPTTIYAPDPDNPGSFIEAGTMYYDPETGDYTFVAKAGFVGKVPVQYNIEDEDGDTDNALLIVDVLPETDPETNKPVAIDDTNTVEAGGTVNTCLTCNDSDPDGGAITVKEVKAIGSGGAAITLPTCDDDTSPTNQATVYDAAGMEAGEACVDSNGEIVFTAKEDYKGKVPFTYTAEDEDGNEVDANAVVTVYPEDEGDNDTYANDDAKTAMQGETVTGNALTNDNDPEGHTQKITSATSSGGTTITIGTETTIPGVGKLTLNEDGSYTFVPDANYTGTESIVYEVCDDQDPAACEKATIYLTILPIDRDYSDLGSPWPIAWNTQYKDADSNNVPDGMPPVWAGSKVTYENEDPADVNADSEDDGLTGIPTAVEKEKDYDLSIVLNSGEATTVHYGLWIDWDGDGTFDDFYSGSGATSSPVTVTQTITSPSDFVDGTEVAYRLRVDDEAIAEANSGGKLTNGETEDYQQTTALPIELGEFVAFASGENAELNWTTLSETSNSHFEIERSFDGLNFDFIGHVDTQADQLGNSSQILDYHFTDKSAAIWSDVIYYRLKQLDLDGTFAFSAVRLVEFSEVVVGNNVFPNPLVRGEDLIVVSNDIENVKVFGNNGQLVFTKDEVGKPKSTSINTSNFSNGLHIIVVNNKVVMKVIVQ